MMEFLLRPLKWTGWAAALLAAICMAAIPLAAPAQVYVGFTIGAAPPPLPYYSQPALSVPGEIWQPGYWAWGSAGYYWVPGTWVNPPSTGMYWTPGYWGYNNGGYAWNNGYWGPQVGYYGGVDYGYGYNGTGYVGGLWNNGVFRYNTAVTAVNPTVVRNVYINRTVVHRTVYVRRYSYNGPGGVRLRPTTAQLTYARERHIAATRAQIEHARIAAQDRNLYASVNHGRPATAAVARPIDSTAKLPHYRPVTAADRRAAQEKVRKPAAPAHTATVHKAPAHAAPVHKAPAHTPPVHEAPAHKAPVHASPEHVTPVHAAQPEHAPPAHAAPAHQAPAHQAPAHQAPAKPAQPSKDNKKPPSA